MFGLFESESAPAPEVPKEEAPKQEMLSAPVAPSDEMGDDELQLQKRDFLDAFFETVEANVCPADTARDDVIQVIDAEKEADRIFNAPRKTWTQQDKNVLKGVVMDKLRDDYKKLGRKLDKLSGYAYRDDMSVTSTSTTGAQSTYRKFDEQVRLLSEIAKMSDASTVATTEPKEEKRQAEEPVSEDPKPEPPKPEEPAKERRSVVSSKRNSIVEEARSAPVPEATGTPEEELDLLDSTFETLESKFCCVSTM